MLDLFFNKKILNNKMRACNARPYIYGKTLDKTCRGELQLHKISVTRYARTAILIALPLHRRTSQIKSPKENAGVINKKNYEKIYGRLDFKNYIW